MSAGRPIRVLITVIADILIVLAIALTIRLVVQFFGGLAGSEIGGLYVDVTDRLVLPVGLDAVKTPYGGIFSVDTAITIGVVVGVEWILGSVRSRA